MTDDPLIREVAEALRALADDETAAAHGAGRRRDLVERVAEGVRRRRRRTLATSVSCAVIAGAVALVATLLPSARSSTHTAIGTVTPTASIPTGSATLTCPDTGGGFPNPVSTRAGSDHELVPGSPVVALVCRYETTAVRDGSATVTFDRAGNPEGSATLRGSEVTALAKALGSGPPPSPLPCPAPFAADLVVFGYSSGPPSRVLVTGAGPCLSASNGTAAFSVDTATLDRLATDSLACPATHDALEQPPLDPVPASEAPREATNVVPLGPQAAIVCRYSGQNAAPPTMLGDATTLDAQRASALARAIDASTIITGERFCPSDDGSGIEIILAYESLMTETIDVHLSGCGFARVKGQNGYQLQLPPQARSIIGA